jgi:hypothetical protein
MADRLVETLGRLIDVIHGMDPPPRILIQLFIDVSETVEDLQMVRRCSLVFLWSG